MKCGKVESKWSSVRQIMTVKQCGCVNSVNVKFKSAVRVTWGRVTSSTAAVTELRTEGGDRGCRIVVGEENGGKGSLLQSRTRRL